MSNFARNKTADGNTEPVFASATLFHRFLSSRYENVTDRELVGLDLLFSAYPWLSIDDRLEQLKHILLPLNSVETKTHHDTARYKSNQITLMSEMDKIGSVLDIGAGSGNVLEILTKELGIPKENAYVVDVAGIIGEDKPYTVLEYDENNKIPLPDNSIDLIILTHVLHHVHPEDRIELLKEAKRILSPQGRIVIQEHDDNKSTKFYYEVDIYHLYWTIITGHPVDPLFMESKQEMETFFREVGLVPRVTLEPSGWQRMYWTSFSHQTNEVTSVISIPFPSTDLLKYRLSLEYKTLCKVKMLAREKRCFDDSLLRITFNMPRTPYHSRVKRFAKDEFAGVKIGQLKLFIIHLQHILENWDPNSVKRLIVVYAGAAPGHNFEVLSKMFRSIEWHLYDPAEFMIKETNTIRIHTGEKDGYFTDKVAKKWSGRNDVIFFSDIRPRDFQEGTDKAGDTVKENMNQQANWVRIIRPISASLKFRLPYRNEVEGSYSYLYGDIVPQAFGPFGTEARLVPKRNESGNYYNVDYDLAEYEDTMFYFQAVTREDVLFSNPLVEVHTSSNRGCTDPLVEATSSNRGCTDPLVECNQYQVIQDDELDNHFDSVYYLRIIKMYSDFVTKYPRVGSINIPLMKFAKDILKKLFSLFSNTTSIGVRRHKITKYADEQNEVFD